MQRPKKRKKKKTNPDCTTCSKRCELSIELAFRTHWIYGTYPSTRLVVSFLKEPKKKKLLIIWRMHSSCLFLVLLTLWVNGLTCFNDSSNMGIIFRNFTKQNFRSLAVPCSQKGLIHPARIPILKPKGQQNHFQSKETRFSSKRDK